MTIQDILRVKGSDVYGIGPDATLGEVVQSLVEHHCGSLLVCETIGSRRHILGIITERDILRACAQHHGSIDDLKLADYMSRELVTADPHESVEHMMGVMTDRRIRHVPVLDGDELVGMVSIGDVVKAQHHATLVENHYLKSYIQS